MRHEIELAYLGIEVARPATLTTPFFGEVIGLVPGDRDRRRSDDLAQRRQGPPRDRRSPDRPTTPSSSARGRRRRGLRRGPVTACAAPGHRLAEGTDDDLAERRRHAPRPHDGARGACRSSSSPGSPTPPRRSRRPRARRVPHRRASGFGHAVFATTGVRRVAPRSSSTASGWRSPTGSRWSSPPGIELEVRFYHCNERHHTLALARAPFELPQALHHVMFETNDRDDVGAAFDRAWATDLADPERARPPRQRRHVQLLRGQPGRVPGRGRPRRPRRSPTTGTTTAATTASAPGATSRCGSA